MEATPEATMQNNNVHRIQHSDRLSTPNNILQTILIEKYRLSFLQQCKYLKRPPQSLRLSGCNTLPELIRLRLVSEFESKALDVAIKTKIDSIKKLQDKLTANTETMLPMLNREKKKMVQSFKKEN